MDTIRRMNFSGLTAPSTSAMAENDSVMASDQKLKKLKKKMSTLYKELKQYTESYRRFISSQQNFFAALECLYEENWVDRSDFKRSLEVLTNIGQNGAKNLETIPIQETIEFKDQFGPYDKQIRDYVEKTKLCETADKKVQTYQKKKTTDPDELRRLQNAAYEKATSARLVKGKLQDELPKFYNSRMEFYSKLWRSVFQIHGDIAKAETETMSQLMSIVRNFDRKRSEGEYDAKEFFVSEAANIDDDDYATEVDPNAEQAGCSLLGASSMASMATGGGTSSGGGSTMRSRHSSGEDTFGCEYAVVQKPQQQRMPPPKQPKPGGVTAMQQPPPADDEAIDKQEDEQQ